MALDNGEVVRLIQQLEADRQAYLSSHNALQELLVRVLANQAENGPSPSAPGPIPPGNSASLGLYQQPGEPLFESNLPINGPGSPPLEPIAPRKQSFNSRRTALSTIAGTVGTNKRKVTSVYSAEDSSDSEAGETFFVQDPLPEEAYTEDQLRDHIRTHQWNEISKYILGNLCSSSKLYARESIFQSDSPDSIHDADHTLGDIYEVDEHGAPLHRSRDDVNHGDAETWEILRHTNVDKKRRQAVGRIVIMREPTPVLFAALHLTMNKHFDMDSLYHILIDDRVTTKAYIKGHTMQDDRRQRSILFSFKYHTLVGKDRQPLDFQNHDPDISDKDDHIPLSTCSSVVAVSFTGKPVAKYRRHSRRSKIPDISHVYDVFAPWHVLSLQCFPDWHSEVNLHETHHHYVNGVDAFMVTLLNEYRDASKRFRDVTARIAKLATPPKEIIFNPIMRDNLLFETGDFVWSRRYFWASQTLGILSDEIDAMIDAYRHTFTDEVWSGEHKTLFPGKADTSARYSNWRKKMDHHRKLFEREMESLTEIRRFCDREQKDIRGLREWLFSGTSVQESRKAVEQASITVEQGYNIKLLTLVTIFFLPLTFVTSVYGMTNMDPNEGFLHFGISVLAICVPTYFLIGIINYSTFQKCVAHLPYPFIWTAMRIRKFNGKSVDWAHQYRDKYMKMTGAVADDPKERALTRAQTFSSLRHRLSMQNSAEAGPNGHVEKAVIEKRAEDSETNMAKRPPGLQHRESTIKWTMPATPDKAHISSAEPSPNTSVPDLLNRTAEGETGGPQTRQRVERPREQSSPRRNLLRRLSAKMASEPAKSPV